MPLEDAGTAEAPPGAAIAEDIGRAARRARGVAAPLRGGRAGQRGEVAVPRHDEPRDPRADERRHRHDAAAARDAAQRRAARLRSRRSTSSGQALLTIINDILDLSRMEAGRLELDSIDFDLDEPAQAGARRGRAARAGEGPGAPARGSRPRCRRCCAAIAGRLRQVLLNLLGNGVKFTTAGEVGIAVRLIADDGRTSCASASPCTIPASAFPSTCRTACSRPTPRPTPRCRGSMAAAGWALPSAPGWSR